MSKRGKQNGFQSETHPVTAEVKPLTHSERGPERTVTFSAKSTLSPPQSSHCVYKISPSHFINLPVREISVSEIAITNETTAIVLTGVM